MANIDNELIKGTLLRAIENAIRYHNIEGGAASEYYIRDLKKAHATLVGKVYKSEEKRQDEWLSSAIVNGTDFGTYCAETNVLKRHNGKTELSISEFVELNKTAEIDEIS